MLRYIIWLVASVIWTRLLFLFEVNYGWVSVGSDPLQAAFSSRGSEDPTIYVLIYILIIFNCLKLFELYSFRLAMIIYFVLFVTSDWSMSPSFLPPGFFFILYFPIALSTWILTSDNKA